MIATIAIAAALEQWAVATLPALQGSYDYQVAAKVHPLPDVAIEITEASTKLVSNLPYFNFEQTMVRSWTVRVFLMVDPEPGDTATDQLAGFIDALQASVISDSSLGGRVPLTGKEMRGSFVPAFVQFDDGTRGRTATLELTVMEPIDEED